MVIGVGMVVGVVVVVVGGGFAAILGVPVDAAAAAAALLAVVVDANSRVDRCNRYEYSNSNASKVLKGSNNSSTN